MCAAPTNIFAYPYTAWCGRLDQPEIFIGEIEAHNTETAHTRVRALHRALFVKSPRRIVLGQAQFLRTTAEGGYHYQFSRNGRPKQPIPLIKFPPLSP